MEVLEDNFSYGNLSGYPFDQDLTSLCFEKYYSAVATHARQKSIKGT
jgi:hypothetical protein